MKSPLKLPRDQVEALRPGDVRLYLTSRGWVPKRNGATDKAMEFRHPSFPGAELLLPLQREVGDFVLRMADVVVSLATIEQRPAWEVLKDVSGPPGDVFRLRVFAADAELGSLPLVEGIDLLRGGRDLLLAAACSAIRPQPLHPLRLPKEAHEFLRSCRLGQTERGSFVATIITPVPPEIQSELTFVEPFSRKVTTGLMSTLGVRIRRDPDRHARSNLGRHRAGSERESLRVSQSNETLGGSFAARDLRYLGSDPWRYPGKRAKVRFFPAGVILVHRGG